MNSKSETATAIARKLLHYYIERYCYGKNLKNYTWICLQTSLSTSPLIACQLKSYLKLSVDENIKVLWIDTLKNLTIYKGYQ